VIPLDNVSKVFEMFSEKKDVNAQVVKYLSGSVHTQNLSGLTVFIEGNGIVFAQLGKKLHLDANTAVEITNDRYVTFRTRDEDGPIQISLDVY
jgi:hypothetical protein